MGHTKAAQMILFAEKLNAHDAFTAGFVAKVIPDHKFREETEKLIQKYTNLSASVTITFIDSTSRSDFVCLVFEASFKYTFHSIFGSDDARWAKSVLGNDKQFC